MKKRKKKKKTNINESAVTPGYTRAMPSHKPFGKRATTHKKKKTEKEFRNYYQITELLLFYYARTPADSDERERATPAQPCHPLYECLSLM